MQAAGHTLPDRALQAYLIKRLPHCDPDCLHDGARGLVGLVSGFDEETAIDLLESLSESAPEGLLDFLAAMLRAETRWVVRVAIVRLLSRHGDRTACRSLLESWLGIETHPRVTATLITARARCGGDLPLRLFKPYLTDPDARVRANALEAFLSRDLAPIRPALSVLAEDSSPRVRSLALLGLWMLGDSRLLERLRRERLPEVRRSYVWALGRTGRDPRAADILHTLTIAGQGPERLLAARALGQVASLDHLPRLLVSAMKSDAQDVREALLASAWELSATGSVEFLLTLTDRLARTPRFRNLATSLSMLAWLRRKRSGSVSAEALDLMGPEHALRFFEHPDPRVVANAVSLAGCWADEGEVREALLAQGLCFPEPRVRVNAAIALWRQGSVRALSCLRSMARSRSSGERSAAAYGLGELGGLIAQAELGRLLDDPEESTRAVVFDALRKVA